MKRILLFLLLLPFTAFSQLRMDTVIGHQGPFVLYGPDQSLRIITADNEGFIRDTLLESRPETLSLPVYSADGKHFFEVTLFDFQPPCTPASPAQKTFVISDPHGQIDAFVALLLSHGVIDRQYRWTYGTDHLVVLGDIFDRGRDDTAIFWLLYKLQKEAREAGGQVFFLFGNHEDLVLKNDLRYIHPAHAVFTEKIGLSWTELWNQDTELGRWIKTGNLVHKTGAFLLVHAGLSATVAQSGMTMDELDGIARQYIGISSRERAALSPQAEMVFNSRTGPLWYRGMIRDSEQMPAITDEELNEVLGQFAVESVIIGHTEVEEIENRYGGRVIAINVAHRKNFPRNGSGAVIIEGNQVWIADYQGNIWPLTAPVN